MSNNDDIKPQNKNSGKFDSFLTNSDEADPDQQYVQPNYIETSLTKERRNECRTIVKTINDFGVSQRQKMYLIYLLSLELENVALMQKIIKAISSEQKEVQDSKLITENNSKASKLIL